MNKSQKTKNRSSPSRPSSTHKIFSGHPSDPRIPIIQFFIEHDNHIASQAEIGRILQGIKLAWDDQKNKFVLADEQPLHVNTEAKRKSLPQKTTLAGGYLKGFGKNRGLIEDGIIEKIEGAIQHQQKRTKKVPGFRLNEDMDYDLFYHIFEYMYLDDCTRTLKDGEELNTERIERQEHVKAFFNSSFYEKMILSPRFTEWLAKRYEIEAFSGPRSFNDLATTFFEDLHDVNIPIEPKHIPINEVQIPPKTPQEAMIVNIKLQLKLLKTMFPQIGDKFRIYCDGNNEQEVDNMLSLIQDEFGKKKKHVDVPLQSSEYIRLLCCAFPIAFIRAVTSIQEIQKIQDPINRSFSLFFRILSAVFQDLGAGRLPPLVKNLKLLPTMEIIYTKELSLMRGEQTIPVDMTKLTGRFDIHR